MPRVRPSVEQFPRAERLAARGLVTFVHPDDLTPERIAAAIQAELVAGISPAAILDMDGLRRSGGELAALLDDL